MQHARAKPLSSTQVWPPAPSIAGHALPASNPRDHVALVQLACESVGSPRLDPKRVLSAGLVIRRIPRTGGVSEFQAADVGMAVDEGREWAIRLDAAAPHSWTPDADPDPTQRPQLQSGQPALESVAGGARHSLPP